MLPDQINLCTLIESLALGFKLAIAAMRLAELSEIFRSSADLVLGRVK